MKKILFILALVSLVGLHARSQQAATPAQANEKPNAVEMIMNESNGNIEIEIPDAILPSILQNPVTPHKNTGVTTPGTVKKNGNLKVGVNRMTGYRIQVFMDGRDQPTLESRARARGNLILSRFPKYRGQVYTYSNSPNWYCRVGNFQTSEEASNAMSELKRAFPNFSGDMRIVKSPIVLIR